MRKIICMLAALCLPVPGFCDAPPVLGLEYSEAKKELLISGFRPLTRDLAVQISPAPPRADVLIQIEKGFPEVISCTGAGIPFCLFMLVDEEGAVFQASVYVPEDGSADRVETFEATEYRLLSNGQIMTRLKLLEERISMTNPNAPLGIMAPVAEITPCNTECIRSELKRVRTHLGFVDNHTDSLTGMNILDFRYINITDIELGVRAHMLSPVPSVSRVTKQHPTNLAYVANQIAGAAIHKCVSLPGRVTECHLIYKDNKGYLFRLTVAGKDLESLSVKERLKN